MSRDLEPADRPELKSYWKANLDVLGQINPGLVNRLHSDPGGDIGYAIAPAPMGRYLCRTEQAVLTESLYKHCPIAWGIRSDQEGEWIHPPADQRGWLPALSDRELARHDLFVIVRMGLGNEVFDCYERLLSAELLREANRRIIAVESRVDLLRAALTLYDWRALLESTRFLLVYGTDVREILAAFWDRYAFSAMDDPLVIAGSGPERESCESTALIDGAVRQACQRHRALAAECLSHEARRRATRIHTHVRRVLWLVPGHNYLQRCCVNALREMGIEADVHLWTSSTYRFVKRFEWVRLLEKYDPDLLILVNATPSTFFGGQEISQIPVRVASWFVDNPRRFVRSSSDFAGVDFAACFDGYYVPYLEGHGVKALEIRTAAGLYRPGSGEKSCEGPAVSFVGELGTRGFQDLDTLVFQISRELHKAARSISEEYAENPGRSVEEIYRQYADTERFPFHGAIVELVENRAAHLQRKRILESCSDLGLVTFGDSEWGDPERAGVLAECWSGRRVDYFEELSPVYSGSRMNINIFHPQCKSAPNPRVYDVLACGGFLLTTDNPGLRDEFTDGEHLVTFRTTEELRDLIRHYRDRPEERRRIAESGRERILAVSRYHDRMRTFVGLSDQKSVGNRYVDSC
ncbi:MAG TPA: glycosyltransferase [bacterium]|nr:glycosyltransferase [bacterium]